MSTTALVLPEKPLIALQPHRGLARLNLCELWMYRDVLYFLTWRDIKIRYKQTVLGAAWAVIQPLFTMLTFWLFFGKLVKIPSDGIPYALFALAGLIPWAFFSNTITNCGNSLVGNPSLVTKVYFPRMIIPGAVVLAGLVDLAISGTLLVILMLWYAILPGWQIMLLPCLLAQLALLAAGVGMWMAALNVTYRDIRYALPFLVQLWMFLTPIIYPASLVPESWRWVLALNPLTGIVSSFRAALFSQPIDWIALSLSLTMTGVVVVSAAYAFRQMETRFADKI